MEYYWTLFNNSSNTTRGHNGNFIPNHAWDSSSWDLATTYYSPPPPTAFESVAGTSGGGGGHLTRYRNPDPNLTCLKLGKRHYVGDQSPPPPPLAVMKRGKAAAPVARCQVEGCEAVLVNAKDYHRRHKVCEMHAKAPKVVLLGIDQRFCQQCSRFHAVGEFDEAKRSCRRRLAGHNERRRKSSQYQDVNMVCGGRHPPQPHLLNSSGCALSLLSPASYRPFSPGPDLPARCSAALRELIAENRASVFACRQLDATQIGNNCKIGPGWAEPENRGHVTLNLMQGPDSAFGLISGHEHRPSEEDGEGDCSELWKLPLGY